MRIHLIEKIHSIQFHKYSRVDAYHPLVSKHRFGNVGKMYLK